MQSRRRLAALKRAFLAFVMCVSCALSFTASATQTVNGITINEDLPQARRGTAYSHTVPIISGGTAPYTFSILGSSTLPTSLTLSSAGVVSGVISCLAGNGNFGQDIRIVDSSSPTPITADFTGNKGLAINVTAGPAGTCVTLTLSPATLPNPTVGAAYSQTITASGGLGPYTYTVSAGALPAGLTLDASTGTISGTPTSTGAYSFTLRATDAAQSTGTQAFSGTVNAAAAIVVDPATAPNTTLGVAYSQAFTATGGTGSYTFSHTGTLPTGLSLSAAGALTGTPTAAGTFNFSIVATDSASATGSRAYTVTINPAIVVNPATLPATTVGASYSQTVTTTGGTGAVTLSQGGTLPPGVTFTAATGVLSGTPTTAGSYDFSITGTDTVGASTLRNYSVTVNAALGLSPASLPASTVGAAYNQTITTSGGTGTITLTQTGSLPPGVTFNPATGVLSGTPTTAGTYGFRITATDSVNASTFIDYSVVINATLSMSPASLPATTVGASYNQTVSASGGTGAKTFAVSNGSLPTGLSLNVNTGVISGSATTAATNNFRITATDAVGATAFTDYSIVVNAAMAISPATLPATTVGASYNQTVSASGGTGTKTFAVTMGLLPAGLALNANTGVISGSPTTAQTANFTITATDGVGATAAQAYSVVVNAAMTINPATLPATTIGVAYSQTISATGGSGSVTFTVSAGALPPGLSLSNGGALTGTPTSSGPYPFTVLATDSVGATSTRNYTLTVNAAIVVNPSSLPDATVGSAYSQTVTTTGGTPAVNMSITGSLPAGVTFTPATGVISGTPTASGTSNFTINATDSVGATGSRAYSLVVNAAAAIVVNPVTAPNTTIGIAYSQTFSATGGNGSYTFSHTGTLPTGLSLNATTGVLSGTPSASGTFNFSIVATDGLMATGSRAYTVTINPAVAVNPATLPAWTAGAAYNQTVSATGGTGTITLVLGGSLPTGLSFNAATGVISGTPTATGTYNFSITGTDTVGASHVRNYSVTINAALAVNPATLPDGTVGSAYAQTITATGGTGAHTFAVTAGALPAGVSLNSATGQISGTPTASGAANFTVTATDSVSATAARAYSVTINTGIAINPATLPASTIGVAYSQTITATGGNGVYSFAVTAGALPAGLSLNAANGQITGTPSASGPSTFTITVTDGLAATGSRAYTVTINAAIVVNPATLPAGTVGAAYSQTVSTTGGTGAVTYAVSAGSLPTGLTLNAASGQVSGTPTANGPFNFTITATDSVNATGSRAYSVTINTGVAVNPASLPATTIGAPYTQTVTATGGDGSYTFAVTAGALPAGLSLNAATGQMTGVPTAAGTSNFTITATDGLGATGLRAYAVTINPAIVVNPATLPASAVGVPYSQTVTGTGGTGGLTFSISTGALPSGLALNAATGQITGTPTTGATASFTVTATDSVGASGSRAYSLTVNAGVVVNPGSLPSAMVGTPYSQALNATGGNGSYTYSIGAGALPAGLALNTATGAISGTPTSTTAASVTIMATDGVGATGSRAYTLNVAAALTVGPATLPNATSGSPYSQMLVPVGGTAPFAFSVSAGALPVGLTLNATTGAISGTPTSAATANFTITVTDSAGFTTTRSYMMAVAPPALTLTAGFGGGHVGNAYDQSLQVSGGVAPYAFSVTGGQPPPGLTMNPATGALTGTPTASGTFTFTVTVVDANGATATFEQTVFIEARPDPTLEASVRGVNAAQIAAASRFGAAQIGNVSSRLQMLHAGHDPCATDINIGTNVRWERLERSEDKNDRPAGQSAGDGKQRTRSGCDRPFAVWAGGNVDFGFLRPSGTAHRNDFTTSGLTLGIDARLLKDLIVGVALGYGRDSTDVDPSGSDSKGQSQSGTVYGSYRVAPSLFVDAMLGQGRLDFDARRFSAPAGMMLYGDRSGSQSFASLGVTGVVRIVGVKLAPYGRVDRVRSTLDSYTETGTATVVLNYGELTVNDDSILVGVRGSMDIPLPSLTLTPSVRLEQRRTRSRGVEQTVAYADTPTVTYPLLHDGDSRDFTTAGIGVLLRMGAVLSVDIEYTYTAGSGTARSETVRALLRAPF